MLLVIHAKVSDSIRKNAEFEENLLFFIPHTSDATSNEGFLSFGYNRGEYGIQVLTANKNIQTGLWDCIVQKDAQLLTKRKHIHVLSLNELENANYFFKIPSKYSNVILGHLVYLEEVNVESYPIPPIKIKTLKYISDNFHLFEDCADYRHHYIIEAE